MAEDILQQITSRILQDNREKFRNFSPDDFTIPLKPGKRLSEKLKSEFTIIAEIKKASPSRGVIADRISPSVQAGIYEKGGAGCISVLTEQNFFKGSTADLKEVLTATSLPVLRKDFIIDISQIYESLELGADAILLIVSCLEDSQLSLFHRVAGELGLEVIVEVHTSEEIERALKISPEIIGINSRNLRDFSVSIDRSIELGSLIPEGIYKIGESGIKTQEDTARLIDSGFSGALVGETLMIAPDPSEMIRRLKHEN